MNTKLYALAIVAHPDDESFLLAGTSFKFETEGKSLGIICATRGEKGNSRLKQKLSLRQIAKVREGELRKAAIILKAGFVKFLDYPDGQLINADSSKLVAKLTKLINAFKPKLIMTFGKEGISGHKDHITIGRAAVTAAKKSAVRPLEIWRASMPASFVRTFNKYLFAIRVHHSHFHSKPLKGVVDHKLLKINIKKFRSKKLQALYCHKSQGLPPWMVHNFPQVRDHFLSCECFEVTKLKP